MLIGIFSEYYSPHSSQLWSPSTLCGIHTCLLNRFGSYWGFTFGIQSIKFMDFQDPAELINKILPSRSSEEVNTLGIADSSRYWMKRDRWSPIVRHDLENWKISLDCNKNWINLPWILSNCDRDKRKFVVYTWITLVRLHRVLADQISGSFSLSKLLPRHPPIRWSWYRQLIILCGLPRQLRFLKFANSLCFCWHPLLATF